MFTYMVANAVKRGKSVIVFTHRKELLTQAGGTFSKFGLKPEFIEANKQPNLSAHLHVAMVETFNRRMTKYQHILLEKDLIIFDEAHLQNFTKLFPFISNKSYVIGATATPYRKPKENQMSEFYEVLVQNMDTVDVIETGKLCMAKSYGIPIDMKGMKKKGDDYDTERYYEDNKIYEGVLENYKLHSLGEKTIIFASQVKSSKRVRNHFVANGFDCRHIDGTTSPKDREEILKWFADTPNAVLCNCGVLTAGFDQPDIKTVILYRATTSLPLFLQMCGRGSRKLPGKDYFKILDFGNNIKRMGFWQDRRTWLLKYDAKYKVGAAPIKECPECYFMMPMSAKECPNCGYVYPQKVKEPEKVILKELTWNATKGKKISQLSLSELITLQKSAKIKAPFVWRVVRSRGIEELKAYADMIGYSSKWIGYQKQYLNDTNYKDYTL